MEQRLLLHNLTAILFFGFAVLATTNSAKAACGQDAETDCIINGKPGTRFCPAGGYPGPCIPIGGDEVESGTVTVSYLVMGVIYSPPGKRSSVKYSTQSTMGSLVSASSSFKSETSVGVQAQGGILAAGESAGFSVTNSESETSSNSVKVVYATTTGISLSGSEDAVNHDNDEILFLINPVISISKEEGGNYLWGLVPSQNTRLYRISVYQLKNPSPNVVQDLGGSVFSGKITKRF